MKTLLLHVLLALSIPCSLAQVVHPALNDDPVFYKVLYNRIDYPISAINAHLYGRVYAGFRIDEKGKIQDITMLSPGNTTGPGSMKSGFEYEVYQALKHMPLLNPRYAGSYALPVAFCYGNRVENRTVRKPVNQLDIAHLDNRLLLREYTSTITVSAKFGPGSEAKEVWGYYAKK